MDLIYSSNNRRPAFNRTLAQYQLMWLINHSSSHQHLWRVERYVFQNRYFTKPQNATGK